MEREKQEAAEREARRSQVKSGDRSEKIRTYNYPQDRVTDHRIGLTRHNLPAIMTAIWARSSRRSAQTPRLRRSRPKRCKLPQQRGDPSLDSPRARVYSFRASCAT